MEESFDARAERYRRLVNEGLAQMFGPDTRGFAFSGLLEAMAYSLMAGGKRIRPMLTLEFCRLCCGQAEPALPAALAVEMLHTYSLIHDDLPCMDNDDMRRGRPSSHAVYGECTAVLAGDALQAEAFGMLARSALPPERVVACLDALAGAAGAWCICGGQFMDMKPEGPRTEEELRDLQQRKTGSLISAACLMGVLAGGGSEEQKEAAMDFGMALGEAFQIRDDMLDEMGSAEKLGKPTGSDKESGKLTFLRLLGPEECHRRVLELTDTAEKSLDAFEDAGFLRTLARSLAERDR